MRHKLFIPFLCGILIHLSHCVVTTTTMMPSPSPTPPPSPPTTTAPESPYSTATPLVFDVEKEMQKVTDFTNGLEILYEVYNSTKLMFEPFGIIGKNFKKIMEASRKCGIILHDGLHIDELYNYFKENNITNAKFTKFQELTQEMVPKIDNFCYQADFNNIQRLSYSSSIDTDIEEPFRGTCYKFSDALRHMSYSKNQMNIFKDNCQLNIMDEFTFEDKLNYIEKSVKSSDYIDDLYVNWYYVYKTVIEHTLATYPMCNIFNNGLPNPQDAYEKAQKFINLIQKVNKKFKDISVMRKEKYWSNENILKIVQKYIFGDITVNAPYTDRNDKIAYNIHKYLIENYWTFGYTYHVGVSNSGTNGNVDTLIQCSTECKFIYGINNKDVYIIRNIQVPAYKECKFLTPNSENPFVCGTTRDSTDLIELAEQIQSKCNPAAFSLVRKRLKYDSEDGTGESYYIDDFKKSVTLPSAFSQKCFGDIYVVMAKTF